MNPKIVSIAIRAMTAALLPQRSLRRTITMMMISSLKGKRMRSFGRSSSSVLGKCAESRMYDYNNLELLSSPNEMIF
jgi:hypothetical protein